MDFFFFLQRIFEPVLSHLFIKIKRNISYFNLFAFLFFILCLVEFKIIPTYSENQEKFPFEMNLTTKANFLLNKSVNNYRGITNASNQIFIFDRHC